MKTKILGILVTMLLIAIAVLPVTGIMKGNRITAWENLEYTTAQADDGKVDNYEITIEEEQISHYLIPDNPRTEVFQRNINYDYCECTGEKPSVLMMQYTGEDCSATDHSQDPGKVVCSGDPMFTSPVDIIATDKSNPDDPKAKIWFNGSVLLNKAFNISAFNAGQTKLRSNTHVFIYNPTDETLLQYIKFHTSCSQPLIYGDQFGSLKLIGFSPCQNNPPEFSDENPENGITDVSVTISELSVTIEDPDGDAMDWTIETSPDIGSSSGTNENNGTKTCSISGLSFCTTYTWYVNASDAGCCYNTASEVYTFTTMSNDPPVISNPDPSNGATDVSVTISELSVTIEDLGGDSFDWSIETSPDIGSSSGTNENNGTKTCSISGLSFCTTYTWYVNASNYCGNTASEVYTFTTMSNDPPVISNPDPSNDATGVAIDLSELSVTIEDPEGDAIDWTIETSPDIGSSSGTNEDNGTKTCSVSGLEYNTTYTWYVNASDPGYCGNTSSEVYAFTTETEAPNDPPEFPCGSKPEGPTELVVGETGEYCFSATDPNDDKVQYRFDWDDGAYSDWTDLVFSGTTACKTHAWGLAGTYGVRAQARDEHGATSNWSSALFVTVTGENDPPYTPSNPDPENGATDVDVDADLSWTCSDPDGDDLVYDVYFEAEDPEPDILVSDDQTETTYDPGEMDGGVTYYWQIIAKDEYSAFTAGPVWHFTTELENQPPNAPSITGKTSGNAGTEYEYTFNSVDPDGDNVKYHIDWDDGDSEETGFNPSGTDVKVKHTWSTQGTYIIKVTAEDTNGLVGPEGTLSVTMPRNRATQRPFLQFLQQYPILYQLLLRFLRL